MPTMSALWVFLSCLMIFATGSMTSGKPLGEEGREDVCYHSDCLAAAGGIRRGMNATANPCDNFYDYVCGSFSIHNPIPRGYSYYSRFTGTHTFQLYRLKALAEAKPRADDIPAVSKMRQLYLTCLDEDAIEREGAMPILKILNEIGGWPMSMGRNDWNKDYFPWEEVQKYYSRLIGEEAFFNIFIIPDSDNSTMQSIAIYPPARLPFQDLADVCDGTGTNGTYVNMIADTARVFANAAGYDLADEDIMMDALEVAKLQTRLSNILKTNDPQYADLTLIRLSLVQLQEVFETLKGNTKSMAHINMINWLDTVSSKFGQANVTINGDENVLIANLPTLLHITMAIYETSPRVLVNYVHWKFLSVMMMHGNKKLRDIEDIPRRLIYGVQKETARWQWCLSHARMADPLSYKYVKVYFPDANLSVVRDMVSYVKKALKAEIENSTWMNDTTKEWAVEKLQDMRHLIGYPERLKNRTAMEQLFDGLEIGPSHFENMIRYVHYVLLTDMKTLRKPLDSNEWYAEPTTVNAFYTPKRNAIVIPAAVAQKPFFSANFPAAVNFGSLGFLVGHEMSHAFDKKGLAFDKFGNIYDGHSPKTSEAYYNKTQCFIEQYNNYTITFPNSSIVVEVNGTQTERENIADNSGIKAAFDAWRAKILDAPSEAQKLLGFEDNTPEQLFFISYASLWCESEDPEYTKSFAKRARHALGRSRITGTLSNLDSFAKAFQCPLGSPMNPEMKCSIWK